MRSIFRLAALLYAIALFGPIVACTHSIFRLNGDFEVDTSTEQLEEKLSQKE